MTTVTYRYPVIQQILTFSNILSILSFLYGVFQANPLIMGISVLVPIALRFLFVITKLIEVKP